MAKTRRYDASSTRTLGDLEAIRLRPGMYVGDNNVHGLHHILFEPVDNAIDEVMGGFATKVTVVLHSDGSASIEDDGRGIPVELKSDSGLSALTELLTQTHSGAKFNREEDAAYSASGGLHGIGIKATNAFSEWLVVEVKRYGVLFRQRFKNGGEPVGPVEIISRGETIGHINDVTELVLDKGDRLVALKIGGKKQTVKADDSNLGSGTKLHFRPFRPWFSDSMEWSQPTKSVPWEFERVETRFEQLAHLYPGCRLELYDERGPKKDHKKRIFKSQRGLLDYLTTLNEGLPALHKPIQFKASQTLVKKVENGGGKVVDKKMGTVEVEVVLQYAGDETDIISFVNGIPTPQGGTAVSGFQSGLTKAVNQFGADKKLIKGDNLRGEDLLLGLTAIINVALSGEVEPQFSSQTKQQLTTPEVMGVVLSATYENILFQLNKHIPVGKIIVSQAQAAVRGREAAKAARRLVMRKSALEVDGLPSKLADVQRGSKIDQTVLYIVEGDSAGGSCKQARDRRHHAILPLRGKVLNAEKATLTKMIGNANGSGGNAEIKGIISAIGAGFGSDFNVAEMRYGAVAILVDADVDGSHIRTLLHTLFWRQMRPLVEAGKLFIATSPLYQIRKGKQAVYAYNDEERDKILVSWGRDGVSIQRYKGLGEMNPAQLRETVFALSGENGPFNEHLVRVDVEDTHRASNAVSTLMGSQVAPRQEWLLKAWAGEESNWHGVDDANEIEGENDN